MKSAHVSKEQFKTRINTLEANLSNFACISITDPCEMKVSLSPYWSKSLALSFLDIDIDTLPYCFTKDMARQVIQYLLEVFQDLNVNTLYIHCHAGISRSRAIHNFFQYYIVENELMKANPPSFVGNSKVYSTLVEVYLTEFKTE